MSANLVTANIALANAPITLRLVNVDQPQGQLNALGMVKPLIPLVKNVVLLIAMKPAVIMALTLAPMVAAARVNAANLSLLQAAHHQVVVPLPAAEAVVVHLAVGVIKQLMTLKDVIIQHIVKQQPLAVNMNIQIDQPEVYMKKLQDVL